MFIPFNTYVKDVYNKLSDELKQKYENNETKHKLAYVSRAGFGHWLNEMRGDTLTPEQVKSVVKTYMQYGKREITHIPGILDNIQNMMNVNVLVEKGMDTEEYWKNKLDQSSEMTL